LLWSTAIWQDIAEWRITREVSVSDHRIIRFRFLADPRVPKKYRYPLSTDWIRFKNELASGLGGWNGSVLNGNDIETNVELQQNIINAAFKGPCLRTVRPGQNTLFWQEKLETTANATKAATNYYFSRGSAARLLE
jgi:hypothetical protein